MSEAVVTEESITDIQDYLQSFNKEIGGANDQNATPTTIASTSTNAMLTDAIYTIDGQKLAGNIVIAESGEHAEQGGNYPTFMVMNDQQYMLIMSDADQAAAGEQAQTLVVTAEGAEEEAAPESNQVNNLQTPTTRKKGAFRNKRIKQEVFEDDDENRNDISVYDFNELNLPNRNNSTVDASIDSNARDQSAIDEDSDSDYKTPIAPKPRGRPSKNAESSKKNKSGSGTLNLGNTSGSGNVHICTYCSYTSNKRYLLSRHLKSHSEDRPHKCGICERGFKTLASLQNHVNTHTGVRPHQCKFCEAAFTTSGELVRHIRYRHTHEKPHRCTECDYASVELSKLKRHMRCHTGERPYQCPHCTYASPDTYKLKRHLRIHTGEKPYVCDVCHQRFTQSNSLKAHRLIHTGNKPIFKCEFCPTTCGRKTDLRIHVQKLHTSDKMLTCKRCDQSFPDRYQFKLHLKTHEGEKCFKCDLCNYASVSARHLESHMLIHTDQKPYICEICALSFRQKQLLKRHKNLYHNPSYVAPTPKEKTHECSQCNKAFRHKGNLIRHMTLHDPDSKNHLARDPSNLDNSQLIDDDFEYEDEDDIEMPEDTSVSIVTDGGILDSTAASVDGTIAITIDPQTQQLINSGNDQVMFVVQYPNGDTETASAVANGQPTVVAVSAPSSTPRIISRSGRVTRNSSKHTNDVQTLFDTVTDEKPNIHSNSGENIIAIQQAAQIAYDNSDTINLEEQLQKQKDLQACFGFKDEDDEDDIILSMPAVDGQ